MLEFKTKSYENKDNTFHLNNKMAIRETNKVFNDQKINNRILE